MELLPTHLQGCGAGGALGEGQGSSLEPLGFLSEEPLLIRWSFHRERSDAHSTRIQEEKFF